MIAGLPLSTILVGALSTLVMVATGLHAVLYKRDVRASVGWVTVIVLVPVVGSVLYVLLGINRIRRRASRLSIEKVPSPDAPFRVPSEHLEDEEGPIGAQFDAMARLGREVVKRPLLKGNAVVPLVNGEEAYPAMLEAIEGAEQTVGLSTYIFDNDGAGERFLERLSGAQKRGVEVRVLVDAVGARYSWPSMVTRLRRAGVVAERFLPTLVPWRMPYLNLRCHRKLLLVDGRVAFTGGMNIRQGHLVEESEPSRAIQDFHCRIEGPVVGDLHRVFAQDWRFVSGEDLSGAGWLPELGPAGEVMARAIPDGPDEDFEAARWVLLGALASARSSIHIVTPYFLPDSGLITSLNVAAMRGVRVEILLPEVNNLSLVQWACAAQLWQLLEKGCRIFLTPPPFDHSKIMVVDGVWSFLGSANWDPRSLRLNFELNVECYDVALARFLEQHFAGKRRRARSLAKRELDERRLPVKVRDGVARLLAPYL